MSVDPAYKVVRSGALAEYTRWKDRTVIDGILGIDVSKNTLDASMSSRNKVRARSFANSEPPPPTLSAAPNKSILKTFLFFPAVSNRFHPRQRPSIRLKN